MATVSYDAKTGKKLAPGGSTTDAMGNTFKQGSEYNPSKTSGSSRVTGFGGLTYDPNNALSSDQMAKRATHLVGANGLSPQEVAAGKQPDPSQAVPEATPATPATGSGLAPGVSTNPDGTVNYTGSAGTSTFNPATSQSKFVQAHQAMDGQSAAPTDYGQGVGAAKGLANQISPPQPVSPLGDVMETDSNFDSIFTEFDKWMEPVNQKQTLLQEYQAMSKSLGIQKINEKLINADKIINGTEDDIRNEVTAAGGFATDSQVQAMSNARNKSLIQNYNQLLATRDNANQQLSTMMNLSIEDRKAGQAEFDRKMDFAFKVQEFQQRAQDNAKTGLKWAIENGGGSEILKNPYETQLTEKILGLPAGSLAGIVKTQNQSMSLDSRYKNAQIDSIYSQIAERNGTIGGVPEKVMGKIQASPEYKTINGLLPALQALKSYKDAVSKYGTSEKWNGTGKGELAGTYANALAAWKSLAGLGALSGADFSLAENAVPETGFFQRQSTMQGKIDSSIKTAIAQGEMLTQRLSQNYPQASDLLNNELDQMKVMAYPDRFQVAPDGQVIEFTN